MSFAADSVPARASGAQWTRLAGELVVLDGAGRMLRGLNATGARVWELIDERRDARAIAAQVASEFEVSQEAALADVLRFLGALSERALVIDAQPARSAGGGG